ncbi:MAG: class I adenylate-forming enzyme family protein [Phenylobacterium sp.]|uniref:class I adenylate-forming enzyme family protein n=1 Tax=Phenylobacterium sp. TaxID=1871053 RepID=UPI0027354351|nr:class I adenylate-forming enzyme family protein [Phenylobacterium sp.]MDP3746397.1 class I adenylate-forming enzyme family protein [Phenylobacterium sp.]
MSLLFPLFPDTQALATFFVERQGGDAGSLADISRQVTRVAQRLAEAGVGVGDTVLFHAGQREEALVLFWAAMARGAIFAPLDETWPDYLVERAAGGLSPRLVACDATRCSLYQRLFPAADRVAFPSADQEAPTADAPDRSDWSDWIGGDAFDAPPLAIVPPSAPAAYLFTSGSTGTPKAVVLSRGALAHGARLTLETFEWAPGERLVNLPEPHTMSGLRNGLVASVLGGLRWIPFGAARRPNLFALLEALEDAKAERLVIGPALVRQLAVLGDRVDPQILASTKAIYCTGAMLSPIAADQFHAHFGVPIVNYYGLTETGGICVSQRLAGWRAGDRSIGTAAGAELRVAPEQGEPAPLGLGELQVRSPQLMSGYRDDPQRTAGRFDDGWLRTGDLARIDADGRVYLVGRSEGFIKTASTDRVAPEEVEMLLEEHPAVAEAAVLGVKTAQDYERIVALVVLRDPQGGHVAETELADFVGSRLGTARTPSQICFVPRLPRRDTGKIIRSELQEMLDEYV